MAERAAVWLRVSTGQQDSDNQLPDVEQFAAHHGYEITERYVISDSAWKNGEGGPAYRKTLKAALDGAWEGRYKVIIVWALDRITRLGAEDALRLIRQFRERGCTLMSVKEPWLNSSPEIVDVLAAFAGWQAQQESNRRSERIRAGIERRKAEGKPVGRQQGAKDARPRKRSGYVAAWEDGGKARAARETARLRASGASIAHTGSVSNMPVPARVSHLQLSGTDRAKLELRRHPARSNRLMAQAAGCDSTTVHHARALLVALGEIPDIPADRRRQRPKPPPPSPARDAIMKLGLDATARQVADLAGISIQCAWSMLRKMRGIASTCAYAPCGRPFIPAQRKAGVPVQIYCSRECNKAACAVRRSARRAEEKAIRELRKRAAAWQGGPPPDLSRGRCATCPPDLRHLWTSEWKRDRLAARDICLSCPVLAACRAWSLSLPYDDTATYGGMAYEERLAARRAAKQLAG